MENKMRRRTYRKKAALLFIGVILSMNIITGIFGFKNLFAKDSTTKTQAEVKVLSAKQAKELIDKEKDVFVLDVRSREEYNEGHIKGANLIPIQELGQNIDKIPTDKKIIVHCAKGGRSTKACDLLKDKGLKELYNFKGGFHQWQSEGYPVEKP